MALYPDVPDLPGVPPLPRNPFAPPPVAQPVLTSDSGADVDQAAFIWGIYSSTGDVVLEVDTVVSLGYAKDFNIATHPLESGGFQSYNKVEQPYDARLMVIRAGTLAERTTFFDTLEALAKSLDLYNIVMPEKVFENANITHVDFDRAADQGANMARANIYLQEVRVTAQAAFSNVRSVNAATTADGGAVQARDPTRTEGPALVPEML